MKKRFSYVSNSSSSSFVVAKTHQMLKSLLDAGQITLDEFKEQLEEYRKHRRHMKQEKWRGVKFMRQPNWKTGMANLYDLKPAFNGKTDDELQNSYVSMVWKTQKGVGYAMPLFRKSAVTLHQVWQLMVGKSDEELKSMFIKKIWTLDDVKQAIAAKGWADYADLFMTDKDLFELLKDVIEDCEEPSEVVEALQRHFWDSYKSWCWEQEDLAGMVGSGEKEV